MMLWQFISITISEYSGDNKGSLNIGGWNKNLTNQFIIAALITFGFKNTINWVLYNRIEKIKIGEKSTEERRKKQYE